ncbi:EAL domain-containing protein [Tepidimonas charontis]|uniref:Putative signaling protein n=1 Tax=Tepidimonas charontis TaxID=2267262 RepID=A0A554XFE1_9BURK|nr:EAL domain-containing protein [Tepidimonas charontis]TSE34509.1 putative signaling protein [Tepidimonas charontis]
MKRRALLAAVVTGGVAASALAVSLPARASAYHHVRIGVLAYRPLAVERADWEPVFRALQAAVPEWTLRWELLDYPAMDRAVRARTLDLIITNPGHYVILHHQEGLSVPLATLRRRVGTHVVDTLGGVAVVRADSPIRHWADLRGRRVAAVHDESLGGLALQRGELLRSGVAPEDVHWLYTGMPHQAVLRAVLEGRADAGFVRDGVVEAALADGTIAPGSLRALMTQDIPGYPLVVSTPLYPEWPVAALPTLAPAARVRLTEALLHLDGGEPLPGGIAGFAPPQPYGAVEALLRALRMPPFGVPRLTLRENLRRNAAPLTVAGAAAAGVLAWLGWTLHQRRLLRATLRDKSTLLDEVAILAKTFDSAQGVVICDDRGRIVRVNRTFTTVTGYGAEEAIGRTPGELLRSGRHGPEFYQSMWQTLRTQGHWEGEIWNRRKDGEIYAEWLVISAITDAAGKVRHYVGIFSDITWRKQAEAQIEQLVFFDPLTGLANRRLLMDRLEQAARQARRENRWGALLFVDLDHFKDVNDTLGHDAGDTVLREVGRRLRSALREQDTAGRLGGDEFLVLLPAVHPQRDAAALAARAVADKLVAALKAPFDLPNGGTITLSASIGITLYGDHGDDETAVDLLKAADLAMYSVKQAGRNGIAFFDPEMEARVRQRHALQLALAQAIDGGGLQLYLQPQVDARGHTVGAEALLRWPQPGGRFVSPAEFIPLAEESGLILPLGAWVLEHTATLLARWQTEPALARLRLAVNVSPRQFREADFVDRVAEVLRRHRLPAQHLELEITESVFLGDLEEARRTLQRLKALGVTLALDDFGTGYSSLSYLAELPFDVIKIDQHFVARLPQRRRADLAIVSTIIALGRKLGTTVLAEGVETAEQAEYLVTHGCHLLQGYHFGRPMPIESFERGLGAA